MTLSVLSIAFSYGISQAAFASEQVGTVTQVEGDVQIFSHPSKQLQKESGTHVLYEDEYYLVEPAKVGVHVELGNIIRTAPAAKARIIFDNGDQFNVGPATAFRIFWEKDARNAQTRMDLAYGKIRGIVEKGGPRSRFQIRTKTATMGVRGTDFFIADGGADGGTEVSIIRGAVEVKSTAPHAKPIEVKQGYSVEVAAAEPQPQAGAHQKKVEPAVELRKTTQEELQGIQRSSVIAAAPAAAVASKDSPHSPELSKLEKKAVETTLKDIKAYDPKLYAQLEAKKPASTDEINRSAVQVLIQEAPHAPAQRKPYKSEVDNLEQGAYEKYFKIQE
jgi:hypothetical protein